MDLVTCWRARPRAAAHNGRSDHETKCVPKQDEINNVQVPGRLPWGSWQHKENNMPVGAGMLAAAPPAMCTKKPAMVTHAAAAAGEQIAGGKSEQQRKINHEVSKT